MLMALDPPPEDNWFRSFANIMLAGIDWSVGRYADALPHFEDTCAYAEERYGRNSASYLNARGSVGVCLRDWGRLDRATLILEDVLDRWTATVDEHSGLDNARVNLARLHLFAGRNDAAARLAAASVAGRTARSSTAPLDLAETYVLLAEVDVARGRPADALVGLDAAEAIYDEHVLPDHWRRAEVESLRGACDLRHGHLDDAVPRLVAAYRRLRETRGVSRITYRAAARVVKALEAAGHEREAAAMRVELAAIGASFG